MSDRAFVHNAAAAWQRVLDSQDKLDSNAVAIAAALWATMNADKLIELAERGARR